ncbi:MAG: AAA family ATPase [Candidatus Dormibacteraeota bacterium]|nr:AAA family ATPase [Candidatus Dormibacteraeota bacterium]
MADVALLTLVASRLQADPPATDAGELVLAALQGVDALAAALRGDAGAAVHVVDRGREPLAPAVYLSSLEVEGFRGIGDAATLTIDPGPGLTLVVGRNGSGKSSFSEALEMLLTGTNQRWKGRTKVWQDGWQNLHHRHTRVKAQFTVDGRRQALTLSREWPDGGAVEASALRIDGKAAPSLGQLGWTQPLAAYPPLLSHNELEHSLDEKQSILYDALAGILGLGELVEAQHRLKDARLAMERVAKEAKATSQQLIRVLEQTGDERAVTALTALRARRWDLETVERTVGARAEGAEHSTLQRLRDLRSLEVLDRDALMTDIGDLREAAMMRDRIRDTDAARADETAKLLEQALAVHTHSESQDCPVCGTVSVLTYEWRLKTAERVAQLREDAASVIKTRRAVQEAMTRARRLITALPASIGAAAGTGVDVEQVTGAWKHWRDAPDSDDPRQLASHLEMYGPPLIAAVASVREAADAELQRRERSWRPAAEAIVDWLPLGKRARSGEASLARVTAAEKWLRDAHDALRDERFEPIAAAVQANWSELRQDSNVSLGTLSLAGTGNSRRLQLDVRVDGEEGSALGVMSQGELNSLALSLFLPRASLPESPFHFVVIDDPVQAMDSSKVEGLARVLERAARDRQVIVLTHDTRLADAVDYLGVRATRVEVVRGENSEVALRRVHDAVGRYLDDARAVANSTGLPPEAARVIPGFCRQALEAACALAVTRRMLYDGKRYDDVQTELARPTTLKMWLALALLKDADRGGDVSDYLRRMHPWAVDIVEDCNRGVHGARLLRDMKGFVRGVEKLAREIAPASDG